MTSPIIITGVGKRIGYALAKHFLAQGQRVIGTYRSHYASIDELTTLGATLYPCDFYDDAQVRTLIAELAKNAFSKTFIIKLSPSKAFN